jgi:hypothetical protein
MTGTCRFSGARPSNEAGEAGRVRTSGSACVAALDLVEDT